MKAGVSFVKKPVRFICIFFGSGVWNVAISGRVVGGREGAYRVLYVFQQAHSIFNYDLIFKTDELDDLLGNPWPNDVEVHFLHVHLSRGSENRMKCT